MKHQWHKLALTIAFLPVLAIAGEGKHEDSMFKNLDIDRNGSISIEEAADNELLSQEWEKLDQNKNGDLEQAEFARFEEMLKSAEPTKEISGGMK